MSIMANWNDWECWNNSIQYQISEDDSSKEWIRDDEGGFYAVNEEMESEFLDVIWMRLFRFKCNCDDFLVIWYPSEFDLYKNNTEYCKNCEVEKGSWRKATYEITIFENPGDVENAIENGMSVSKSYSKLLNKIYPEVLK